MRTNLFTMHELMTEQVTQTVTNVTTVNVLIHLTLIFSHLHNIFLFLLCGPPP